MRELTGSAYLTGYAADTMADFTCKAILVIPGGGYAEIASREGEPIAQAFMPYGYNKLKGMMLIYPDAPHGVVLGNEITKCGNEKWCDTYVARWVKQAVECAEKLGE